MPIRIMNSYRDGYLHCSSRHSFAVFALVCFFFGAVGFPSRSTEAALLNLSPGNPDIYANSIVVNYQYNLATDSGLFTASGVAVTLTDVNQSPDPQQITNGTFSISAVLNGDGEFQSGSTLTIKGDLGDGNGFTTLLSGQLKRFGYQEDNDPDSLSSNGPRLFEFEFDQLQGTLAARYRGEAGVILSGGKLNFRGHFENNFNTVTGMTAKMSADSFGGEVPEPSSLIMWSLVSMAGVITARRKRFNQQSESTETILRKSEPQQVDRR